MVSGVAFGVLAELVGSEGRLDKHLAGDVVRTITLGVIQSVPVLGTLFGAAMSLQQLTTSGPAWTEHRLHVEQFLRQGGNALGLHELRVQALLSGLRPRAMLSGVMDHLRVKKVPFVQGLASDEFYVLSQQGEHAIRKVARVGRRTRKETWGALDYAPEVHYAYGFLFGAMAASEGKAVYGGKRLRLNPDKVDFVLYRGLNTQGVGTRIGLQTKDRKWLPDALDGALDGVRAVQNSWVRRFGEDDEQVQEDYDREQAIAKYDDARAELAAFGLDLPSAEVADRAASLNDATGSGKGLWVLALLAAGRSM